MNDFYTKNWCFWIFRSVIQTMHTTTLKKKPTNTTSSQYIREQLQYTYIDLFSFVENHTSAEITTILLPVVVCRHVCVDDVATHRGSGIHISGLQKIELRGTDQCLTPGFNTQTHLFAASIHPLVSWVDETADPWAPTYESPIALIKRLVRGCGGRKLFPFCTRKMKTTTIYESTNLFSISHYKTF